MSNQEPRTDEATIIKVERLLVEYRREVHSAPLADSTKENYVRPATAFVRWLRGDFEPGSVNRRKPENNPDQFRSIAPAQEPTYQDSLPETVFDRLMRAFPDRYIGLNASGTDHRFRFDLDGSTIYVRPGTLNIARIRYSTLVQRYFPNSSQLLDYAQNEDNGVYHHVTLGRDEYQFGPEHVEDLIQILNRT